MQSDTYQCCVRVYLQSCQSHLYNIFRLTEMQIEQIPGITTCYVIIFVSLLAAIDSHLVKELTACMYVSHLDLHHILHVKAQHDNDQCRHQTFLIVI